MTALGWTVAVGWICATFGGAVLIGRMLDLADRGTTTVDRADWTPFDAVPLPARPTDDWMALVPADCLSDDDPILHDRFFAIVDAETELHDRLLAIVNETRWLA